MTEVKPGDRVIFQPTPSSQRRDRGVVLYLDTGTPGMLHVAIARDTTPTLAGRDVLIDSERVWPEADEEEDEGDGAPCCRAVVTSGDPTQHEPGCYNERPER